MRARGKFWCRHNAFHPCPHILAKLGGDFFAQINCCRVLAERRSQSPKLHPILSRGFPFRPTRLHGCRDCAPAGGGHLAIGFYLLRSTLFRMVLRPPGLLGRCNGLAAFRRHLPSFITPFRTRLNGNWDSNFPTQDLLEFRLKRIKAFANFNHPFQLVDGQFVKFVHTSKSRYNNETQSRRFRMDGTALAKFPSL